MEQWEQIFFVGTSKLLYDCARIAEEIYAGCNFRILDINEDAPLDAYKKQIPHEHMEKRELMDALAAVSRKTLAFSVSNRYIFPEEVVKNPNLTILNLHHGLLPVRAGRNPEMWAIWSQDEYAGITWHFVDEKVDNGAILLQKRFRIGENDTAFLLYKKENEIALEGLREFLPLKEKKDLAAVPQEETKKQVFKYWRQMPNDGILDCSWDLDRIKRFLRATDYGGAYHFPDRKAVWNGAAYEFERYSVGKEVQRMQREREISYDPQSRTLTIREGGETVRLKKRRAPKEV